MPLKADLLLVLANHYPINYASHACKSASYLVSCQFSMYMTEHPFHHLAFLVSFVELCEVG